MLTLLNHYTHLLYQLQVALHDQLHYLYCLTHTPPPNLLSPSSPLHLLTTPLVQHLPYLETFVTYVNMYDSCRSHVTQCMTPAGVKLLNV